MTKIQNKTKRLLYVNFRTGEKPAEVRRMACPPLESNHDLSKDDLARLQKAVEKGPLRTWLVEGMIEIEGVKVTPNDDDKAAKKASEKAAKKAADEAAKADAEAKAAEADAKSGGGGRGLQGGA